MFKNKCVVSTCKNAEESILIFSPLFIAPVLNLYLSKKIQNNYFDKLAKKIRGRYEGILIPTNTATKDIARNQKNGVLGIYGMVADQSPKLKRAWVWTNFMKINVPVFMGT